MLAYAFDNLDESEATKLGSEEFDNAHDFYAEIILNGAVRILNQGLHREYIPMNDDLLLKRGNINISNTIKNRTKLDYRLNCDVDEYSENNLFNRILKTTMLLLMQSEFVKDPRKQRLRSVCHRMGNIETIAPQIIPWTSLQFRRNNISYQIILEICHYALDELLMTEEGDTLLSRISSDERMSKLYEHFILNYFEKHYKHSLNVGAKKIAWDINDSINNMPIMQSDVMIWNQNKVLIIDAKLYTRTLVSKNGSDKKTFISSNMYQIFTYVTN